MKAKNYKFKAVKIISFVFIVLLIAVILIQVFRPFSRVTDSSLNSSYKCPDCNVIFILVDTLRADHLGIYGYYRNTSPTVDQFARENIYFTDARSQAACTFPSVNSILTSRYPSDFLGQPNNSFSIPAGIKSISEIFKENNFTTIAVSASQIVRKTASPSNKQGGFDRGFDIFDEECFNGQHATCINKKALEFIDAHNKIKFFMYLHYMEPHASYSPPKNFTKKYSINYKGGKQFINDGNIAPITKMLYDNGSYLNITEEDINQLINLYDDEILYFDSQFKMLLNELSKRGILNNTIIVILADHGENFLNEHGEAGHCRTVWESVTRVPLIIKIPQLRIKRIIESQVQNLDITPTLLDYLNISSDNYHFEGKSLRQAIENEKIINNYTYSSQGNLRSIADNNYKIIKSIKSDKYLLFDIKSDPSESKDISLEKSSIMKRFKVKLNEQIVIVEGKDTLKNIKKSEEIKKELKSLGYIG